MITICEQCGEEHRARYVPVVNKQCLCWRCANYMVEHLERRAAERAAEANEKWGNYERPKH